MRKPMAFAQRKKNAMRALVQRVSRASVEIEGKMHGQIGPGLLILVGITHEDDTGDVDYLVQKCAKLRIFDDPQGVMNLDVNQINGRALVISQFTLHAATRKGNRPSYIRAAGPEAAVPLYEAFIRGCQAEIAAGVETGIFGAEMKVELVNDGPVTILIDSKNKE